MISLLLPLYITVSIIVMIRWPHVPACNDMTLFWAATVAGIGTALHAWQKGNRLSQTEMLLVHCVLASAIILMVTALFDISDISLLGEKHDAETGLLAGGFIAFTTAGVIAARLSRHYPGAVSWGLLLAYLSAIGIDMSFNRDIEDHFGFIVTCTAITAVLIAFLLLSSCRKHLNDNQFLSSIGICSAFLMFMTPTGKDMAVLTILEGSAVLLAGLCFMTERRRAEASQRAGACMLLISGSLELSIGFLHKNLGVNEIVAGIPPALLILLCIGILKLEREEIPRGCYLVIQFTFVFLAVVSLLPDSDATDIHVPLILSLLLFILALIWYAPTPQPSQGMLWRHQFRMVMSVSGLLCGIAVTGYSLHNSLQMLTENHGYARQLAKLSGTPLWPGDRVFLRLAMREESFWPDSIKSDPLNELKPNSYLTRIRPSGDRFSHVLTADDYENHNRGYDPENLGLEWRASSKRLLLSKVDRKSPAGNAGLLRGDEIIAINGTPVRGFDETAYDRLFTGWVKGRAVSMHVAGHDGRKRHVSLTIGDSYLDPPVSKIVNLPHGGRAGYLYIESFNTGHLSEIDRHFAMLKKEGVRDLVLDLRYNIGGSLVKARDVASYIAGGRLQGKTFANFEHHPYHSDLDVEYRFRQMPETLNARRVVVITTDETCSASETIINGLKPHIPVHTVGSNTCGKPYGMRQIDFGDKVMMPVVARVLNSNGEGHYVTGIRPDVRAKDDLTHQLGDPEEGMLKAALVLLGRTEPQR